MTFSEKARNFFRKWYAFFRPVDGWKERYRAYRAGVNTWPVPGKLDKPYVVPFPVEWIPARLELTEQDGPEAHARGFVLLDTTCVDTGNEAPAGVGVCCLRCGVHLHPIAANMYSTFDPPYCRRCKKKVRDL